YNHPVEVPAEREPLVLRALPAELHEEVTLLRVEAAQHDRLAVGLRPGGEVEAERADADRADAAVLRELGEERRRQVRAPEEVERPLQHDAGDRHPGEVAGVEQLVRDWA